MTTGHVFMPLSLDGFVARSDGGVDWLNKYQSGGEDLGFAAFMASVDGRVIRRASYENVLTFGEWFYTKPVIVMSRSLTDADIPEKIKDRVRLSVQTPEDLIPTRVPILLGGGIPLFGTLEEEIDLEHIETTTFPSGLVSSKYKVC